MKKNGFTLAEVLITLVVIGIIAMILIPSLSSSIQEKVWDSQRKALHARLAQALPMLPYLARYGSYTETSNAETGKTDIVDNSAESFVTEGLSKVYKVLDVCKMEKMENCGISSSILNASGTASVSTKVLMSDMMPWQGSTKKTKPVAFTTRNDESILLYYNPDCTDHTEFAHYSLSKICANFIYDLNGTKGPNQVGKDVGVITAFYNTEPEVVAPLAATKDVLGPASLDGEENSSASELCLKADLNSRLPSKEELVSLFANRQLFWRYPSGLSNGNYLSNSQTSASSVWILMNNGGAIGRMETRSKKEKLGVLCVKK